MARLQWGKPLIYFANATSLLPGGYGFNTTINLTNYTLFNTIKEGTASLTTNKGDKTEAKGEGGEIIDARYNANSYTLEFEVFAKDNELIQMTSLNGVIQGVFSVIIYPEDYTNLDAIAIQCATASVEESWNATDGKTYKYTFEAILPSEHAASGQSMILVESSHVLPQAVLLPGEGEGPGGGEGGNTAEP